MDLQRCVSVLSNASLMEIAQNHLEGDLMTDILGDEDFL